jgi:hypothetical protein
MHTAAADRFRNFGPDFLTNCYSCAGAAKRTIQREFFYSATRSGNMAIYGPAAFVN